MAKTKATVLNDFKGIGYSKIGYFKEVQGKIKELEKLNLELARRHNRLEAIFNSMSDGLIILDRDSIILFANEVMKTMFPQTSLIGNKCYKALYRKEKRCYDCPALHSLESGENHQGEHLDKSGVYAGRYYEWHTSPIKNPAGQADEVLLLLRDITQRKESEHKLMQADRMATIGFLAAGIAHEINNPLTSIAGCSQGLLKRLVSLGAAFDHNRLKSFKEYLEIIHSEAYRCKDIIQNLQEFSRSFSDEYVSIPIDQIIENTISLFRQHAKDSGTHIAYTNHFSSGLNYVFCKESQMKHLFLNLFHRAVSSVEKGGTISLFSCNRGNQVEVNMHWDGLGQFDPLSDSIFDPTNLSESIGEKQVIDLSICYNIVYNHHGEIYFNVEGDKQSKFIIRFPVSLP